MLPYILVQWTASLWFFLIHFVQVPPLNDIDQFPNAASWNRTLAVNFFIQQVLLIFELYAIKIATVCALVYWTLLLFGHVCTWWLPYLFGWPKVFVEDQEIDHKVTVRFLPSRGRRPVPDVAYCILGASALAAVILTIARLFVS